MWAFNSTAVLTVAPPRLEDDSADRDVFESGAGERRPTTTRCGEFIV